MDIYLSAQCELRNFTEAPAGSWISLSAAKFHRWSKTTDFADEPPGEDLEAFSIGWLISTISNNGNGGETSGFQPQRNFVRLRRTQIF